MRIPLGLVPKRPKKGERMTKNDDSSTSSTIMNESCSSIVEHLLSTPQGHGLLITLQDNDSGTCCCKMTVCGDAHYRDIHPNIYAPAELVDARPLPGGGSGAAVFGATHPVLQDVVMKHGGYREMRELFALATIAQELSKRSVNVPSRAADLQERIPEFKFFYLSPQHLAHKDEEFWSHMKNLMRAFLPVDSKSLSVVGSGTASFCAGTQGGTEKGRRIRVCARDDESSNNVSVHLSKESLDLSFHSDNVVVLDEFNCQCEGEGYLSLKALVKQLESLQKKYMWKFTLGQKTIGGPAPQTAASFLAAGQLHGGLLETLIVQFIDVIRDLQAMTSVQESNVIATVRQELARIAADETLTAADISSVADAFCGYALKKNWHPKVGRFVRLRDMGAQFRSGSLDLTPLEELPARHLGVLLQRGSRMSQVYEGAPVEDVALDLDKQKWRSILEHAVAGIRCGAAFRRVWTCGFSDAGLHNLFLSRDKLWLFDLGEPSLQALPGFLTKFLFSFFHTLGMVENDSGGWVNRFVPGQKLALTDETKVLLPKAYEAFEVTLDRLSDELFYSEDGVRGLLVQYITVQLLSDCAFCLERWALKGGGSSHKSNREAGIEKWLWRALWDIYVAFDINTKEWTCEPYRCHYSAFRRTPSGSSTRKRPK